MPEETRLHENREKLYQFLSRVYMREIDKEFLDRMNEMSFPADCSDLELKEGYTQIKDYLKNQGNDPITDLAVDYARVFLGAGASSYAAAYPYESVYTGNKPMMMQEARDEVMELYRKKGLKKSENLDFPEDHIALELEFMAFLCNEAKEALEKEENTPPACLKEQLEFLEKHLLNWAPKFCADIEKYASKQFYKGAAKVTIGYLKEDKALLKSLVVSDI